MRGVKLLSTKAHGILDYVYVATAAALPFALGWGRTTQTIAATSAGGALLGSLLTDYELGVVRVLPMKAHLGFDYVNAVGLLAAAALVDDDDVDRAGLAALGLVSVVSPALTETA